MNINIDIIPASDWHPFASSCHELVFGEFRRADVNRFDFAIVTKVDDRFFGYMTCKETDESTLYISYGGVFPDERGIKTLPVMKEVISRMSSEYLQIDTMVENVNVAILKLYLQLGFLVVGTSTLKGATYLHLRKEV